MSETFKSKVRRNKNKPWKNWQSKELFFVISQYLWYLWYFRGWAASRFLSKQERRWIWISHYPIGQAENQFPVKYRHRSMKQKNAVGMKCYFWNNALSMQALANSRLWSIFALLQQYPTLIESKSKSKSKSKSIRRNFVDAISFDEIRKFSFCWI
jgi:hypothetical protein